MRFSNNHPPPAGLDWRQALQRYALHTLVCQRCNELLWGGAERAEVLCTFHLYACELGTRLETARRRILIQLARRITFLSTSPRSDDLPS